MNIDKEYIEEILIDFGSKFEQKEPNGKISFRNADLKYAAEKIAKLFPIYPVMRSFTACPSCKSKEIYFEGHWTCKTCTYDWGGK